MKKLPSILLTAIILVCMLSITVMAASANDLPEVTISTGGELIAFIKDVNNGTYPNGVNAVLTADLDISYTENVSEYDGVGYDDGGDFCLTTPIGCDEEHPFKGTFDGQGHYIDFMFDSDEYPFDAYGLFGVNSGTIKNLTVGYEGTEHQ